MNHKFFSIEEQAHGKYLFWHASDGMTNSP